MAVPASAMMPMAAAAPAMAMERANMGMFLRVFARGMLAVAVRSRIPANVRAMGKV